MTAEKKKEFYERFVDIVRNNDEYDGNFLMGEPEDPCQWIDGLVDEACKKQRESDAEIFKSYCEVDTNNQLAYSDDFSIYCKILANTSPKESEL